MRMASLTGTARLAADIGGTFTDVVLEVVPESQIDSVENPQAQAMRRFSGKVLTTTDAPERGVLEGITLVLQQAELQPQDIDVFIHGTTLATNALIERKGARTAFVTTAGFRDILEMGYEKRFDHYDLMIERPAPLVPRDLRFGINERLSAKGEVLVDLDTTQVEALAAELSRLEIEAVAIGLLHAQQNTQHEQRIGEILQGLLPQEISLCLSSEVCPEIREYERFSTTVANAYVRPLMASYLQRMQQQLTQDGFDCPLYLMMSGGGLTTLETARRFPIRLVESGPAGGAILAAQIAKQCELDEVLSFDMGGTTAKICLLENAEPERARMFEVARAYRDMKGSGLPVRIPVIEMVEIGAGGGSIARVDELQRITVGPDSAGSDPGPVCYGRGGDLPAVTDANLTLGKIDPKYFAGGKIELNSAAAAQALQKHIGAKLDLDAVWSAAGVAEIVEENMANAARVHTIERGRVAERHTMIAFGGGAPLHAGRLAEKLGIQKVVIPSGAGVGSAIGFLRAPIAYEVTRSFDLHLSAEDFSTSNDLLSAMRQEALAVVKPALQGEQRIQVHGVADARYLGQGHELRIQLPGGDLSKEICQQLRKDFESLYEKIYGLTLANIEVEIVTISVTATIPAEIPQTISQVAKTDAPNPVATRDVYDAKQAKMCATPVYWRFDLDPGCELQGPALIVENETTTLLPNGYDLHVNGVGYLVMQRVSESI